jgi:hypothetical protein
MPTHAIRMKPHEWGTRCIASFMYGPSAQKNAPKMGHPDFWNCLDLGHPPNSVLEQGMIQIGLILALIFSAAPLPANDPGHSGGTTTFALPKPQPVLLSKPMDCRALATTFVSEKAGHLEAETSVGTDHLTIVRVAQMLKITSHHTKVGKDDQEDVDFYSIRSETVDFVSAVQATRQLPVVHGLVINKRLGSAVWSESDSTFVLVSDYPMSTTVFLNCTN